MFARKALATCLVAILEAVAACSQRILKTLKADLQRTGLAYALTPATCVPSQWLVDVAQSARNEPPAITFAKTRRKGAVGIRRR